MIRQGFRLSTRAFLCGFARASITARQPITVAPFRLSPQTKYSTISTQGENIEDKIDNVSGDEYHQIADTYLEGLGDDLEVLGESNPKVEYELASGFLTLNLPPNGTYVIIKQAPNKQIWLSSPISGPKRYDLIGGKWITLRDGSSLTELLEKEISDVLQTEYKFESVEN